MQAVNSLHRYVSIIKSLEKRPKTLAEIRFEYETRCMINGCDFIFSAKTFERDRLDILSLFKIDIKVRPRGLYYIDDEDLATINEPKKITDFFF